MFDPMARIGAAFKALFHPGGALPPGASPSQAGRVANFPAFIPADAAGRIIPLGMDCKGMNAGPPWENSATAIALDWVIANFPQANLQVERKEGKGWSPVEGHPMVSLLYDPTPNSPAYDFYSLWGGALLSCLLDGNGYWLKARDSTGVAELWWAPHTLITPFRPDPRKPEYKYLYRATLPGSGRVVEQVLEPPDVVHFKHGPPDPANDLKACAPHRRCLKEVCSDNEVAAYIAAILFNRGIPGIVAVYQGPGTLTQSQADNVKGVFKRSWTGENRGETAVIDGAFKLEAPAFNPDQLKVNEISRIPEARICAALGVAPMVVGLNVGDDQRTYSNLAQAERQTWRRLRAVQGRMAESLYRQLLPDFEGDRRGLRVGWSYAEVEALQEDRESASRRAISEYRGGLRRRGEGRQLIGLPPAEDGSDDVYFTQADPAQRPPGSAVPPQDEKAARVLDRIEAALDADDLGSDRGRLALPDRPEGAVGGGGGPVGGAGQPAWPARWGADQQGDGGPLPEDEGGHQVVAGGAADGPAADGGAGPGDDGGTPGRVAGEGDPAVSG